jgi:hypothetical protein
MRDQERSHLNSRAANRAHPHDNGRRGMGGRREERPVAFAGKLLALLDHAVAARFVRPEHRSLLLVSADPAAVVSDLMIHAGSQSQCQGIDFEKT